MKLSEELGTNTHDNSTTASPLGLDGYAAGPSSAGLAMSSGAGSVNGHGSTSNGNGFMPSTTNGVSSSVLPVASGSGSFGNGVVSNGKPPVVPVGPSLVRRVDLLGTTLYDDGSNLDREEYVRLVLQSLRDVGYTEAANTLEAESGYSLETSTVSSFRRFILEGDWAQAERTLLELGVEGDDCLLDARFLISQQKYLELLEAGQTTDALNVLRNELATLDVDAEELRRLSSLIMCTESEDLRERAGWEGVTGNSRQALLVNLQRYIPPSIMIPSRRMASLLVQARTYQLQHCVYHNIPSSSFPVPSVVSAPSQFPYSSRTASVWTNRPKVSSPLSFSSSPHIPTLPYHPPSSTSHLSHSRFPSASTHFSLFTDHQCDPTVFPRITTTILHVHTDEVWNVEWSHDGTLLASGGKDRTAVIWRVGSETGVSPQKWETLWVLRDLPYSVGCLTWSTDDTILLTGADNFIKLWNAQTGVCIRTLDDHTDTVTAMEWLPDGSGFISASLDKTIIHWDARGNKLESWGATAMRITDIAITPDLSRVVTVGMDAVRPISAGDAASPSSGTSSGIFGGAAGSPSGDAGGNTGVTPQGKFSDNWILIFDLNTKEVDASIRTEGELTSVKISQNSQYALINHAPDEIHLWDLHLRRVVRKYTGQRQGRYAIRSCFGGADGNFVVSGSEDSNIYVWHRDTGSLLEVLSGHGEGSVNCVAWNPRNERMFASCSDDHTIRIWEAPSSHAMMEAALQSMSSDEKGKTRWEGDGTGAGL